METEKFLKLVVGDEVVLNLFADDFPIEVITPLLEQRSQSPSMIVLGLVTIEPLDRVGGGPNMEVELAASEALIYLSMVDDASNFYVTPWHVLRKATEKDKNSTTQIKLAALDTQVIKAHPSLFIATKCGYRWLPSHGDDGPRTSVRDRYMKWEKEKADDEGISKDGGMLALLEYRSTLCERLLAQVATLTKTYSTKVRRVQVDGIPNNEMSQLQKQAYIADVKPLVGNAPGSTEPSSDIDINTQGDGTEFAVCTFNALFRQLHKGNEPGIVFDVNIYGKDFLPSFEGWPTRDKNQTPSIIRPYFDHEFTDYEIEKQDADIQLRHAFTKLRRYSTDDLWLILIGSMPQALKTMLDDAKEQHLKWAFLIAQVYTNRVSPENTKDPTADIAHSGEGFLADRRINPAMLMATQNRFYEHFLRTDVELKRDRFNLLKFKDSIKKEAADSEESRESTEDTAAGIELDKAYSNLREAMSKSLYFANEAYVTAGAVLQTVGGKQKKSKGVTAERFKNPPQHNIAYTAPELMACVVDQLADIHKEAGRHFAEEGKDEDVGGALLGCGKYIHRLLNATKHLYLLFKVAQLPNAINGYPENSFNDPETWKSFRQLGFGLEALKKRNFTDDKTILKETLLPVSEDVYQKLKDTPTESSETLLSLLVNKFSLSRENLNKYLTFHKNKEWGKLANKEGLAWSLAYLLSLKQTLNEQVTVIEDEEPKTFYAFFDKFLAVVLKDYQEYKEIEESTLVLLFDCQPPFTLASQVLTAKGKLKDVDHYDSWEFDFGPDEAGAEDEGYDGDDESDGS